MFQIDGRQVGGDRCYVVAEIGSNHGGNLVTAQRMIRMCADAGADAVKLQKRDNRTLYTRAFYDSPYNSENAYGPTYGAHREALEFNEASYRRLQQVAAACGITLFATAFDEASVAFCARLGMPAIKIASGDLTNTPLIATAASVGVPLLISTGGGTMEDIGRAHEAAVAGGCRDIAILQCTASYPCAYEQLDLGVLAGWRTQRTVIGASIHASGISAPVMAYCMGARIIELHVTLDRTLKGTDQSFSIEPQGLRKVVRDLRRAEVALGNEKRVHESELEPLRKMAKVLVAARDLPAGHVLQLGDVVAKSPADPAGLPPYRLPDLIGCTLDGPVAEDGLIPASVVAQVARAGR